MQEYAERLSRYTKLELLELPAATGRHLPTSDAKRDEARALLAKRGPKDWVIPLDEGGELLSSMQLSSLIGRAQTQSHDLLFAIGGDEGLGTEVIEEGYKVLSLSRLTLPHRLARLILVEQLYRAFTLLRGEPYHK